MDALCSEATATCAPGEVRFQIYLRQGGGAWQPRGEVCLGPDERPTTVADIGRAVREQVLSLLPDANPSFQPRQGGIVNLPTLFAAGEPQEMSTRSFDVLGFAVVVHAQARWEWSFDDGVVRDFAVPGGAYPNQDVSFTYTDPGPRQVSVTTFWRAQFTVDGAGPYDVPGPEISKTAGPFQVPVREAHAELIGG